MTDNQIERAIYSAWRDMIDARPLPTEGDAGRAALEAHEHSDGRDLLRDIDAALPAQALASLSPAKDEESGNG